MELTEQTNTPGAEFSDLSSDQAFFLKTHGCVVRTINSIADKLGIHPQQDILSQRQKQIEEEYRLALEIDQSNQDKPFLTKLKAAIDANESIYQMEMKKIHQLLSDLLKGTKVTGEIIPIRSSIEVETLPQLLKDASKNPRQALAIIVPTHMAHIKAENGQIIFLSDENDRQEPIRITEDDFQIWLNFILINNRQVEIVIFYQDEEPVTSERENVDKFFDFSHQDLDYQQALSKIKQLKEQNKLEKPLFALRIDNLERQLPLKLKVNPYPTVAGWDSNSLGKLTEKEAALLTALARKATYLYEFFWGGYDNEKKIKHILQQLQQKTSNVPVIWLTEVSNGILDFCSLLAKVSDINQLQDCFIDPIKIGQFAEAYKKDGNKLGKNCVMAVSEFITSLPVVPEIGDTETDKEQRTKSRNLGVGIASIFFLNGLLNKMSS